MAAPDQRPHHKPAMAEPAERILHAVQKLLAFAAGPKRQASPGRPFSRCRFGAAIFQKRASATLTCKAGYPAFFSIGSVLPNWPICTLLLCHPSDPFRGNRPKPALIAYNPPNGVRSPTHSASLSRVSTASCMLGRAGSLVVVDRSAQSLTENPTPHPSFPRKAGIQGHRSQRWPWAPAFAGVTTTSW